MASPPNWDANNDLWSYTEDFFVSPPTSLLIAGGSTTLLCTLPPTLNLVSGRISTWQRVRGKLAGRFYLFRNQEPLGYPRFVNSLVVYIWNDRVKLWYYKDNVQYVLKDDNAGEWPVEEWYLTRLTWWEQVGPQCVKTLFVKVELWDDPDWIEKALWEVPENYYSDTGIARVGYSTIDWMDDFLIEAVA